MDEFEKKHLANLRRVESSLRKIYEGAIQQIAIAFNYIDFNGEQFRLKDFPALNNRMNALIKSLGVDIYAAAVNGIEASWDLSNTKNNILVDKRLAGKKPSDKGAKILYDANQDALKQFIARTIQGLSLSQRVWHSLDNYKTELETELSLGISEGRSAVEMARDLKRYMDDPSIVIRKLKQNQEKLDIPKSTINKFMNVGQGVYRSSFQNALRVTATETNAAYRNADIERWRTLPFVIGYKINLSANHPEYDICDTLKGVYPLDFNWTSWHPRCICFLTPMMISDADYDKFEDAILDGETPASIKELTQMPIAFRNYVTKNAERINGWNSKPFWVTQNRSIVNKYLK